MAKNADGPASGRTGFGYEQAKDAGVPWSAISPRPISEVNADIQRRQEQKADQEDLAALLAEHPTLKERAEEMRRLRWSEDDTMYQLKMEAREFRRRRLAAEGKL
ncbi:MAG: hypothetical protein HY243_18060 [Proteobacteria bacterium]|nr:hypothetical protein [Pseudomonadota bacterium]